MLAGWPTATSSYNSETDYEIQLKQMEARRERTMRAVKAGKAKSGGGSTPNSVAGGLHGPPQTKRNVTKV